MVRPSSPTEDTHEDFDGGEDFLDNKPSSSRRRAAMGAAGNAIISRSPGRTASSASLNQVGFVQKLFSMLNDDALSPYLSWRHGGSVFSVTNPTTFAQHVLPNWFKHANFQSFVRQLNMYSFHKYVAPSVDQPSSGASPSSDSSSSSREFHHPSFHRDRPELLCTIHRKPAKGSHRASAASASTSAPKSPNSRTSPSSRGSSIHSDDGAARPRSPPAVDWRPTAPSPKAPPLALHGPTPPRTANPLVDHDLASRVASLTDSVQSLTRALDRTCEDAAEERRATTGIMWMLLGLVATADPTGANRPELELAHAALTRFDPSPAQPFLPRSRRSSSHRPTPSPQMRPAKAPYERPSSATTPYERPSSASSWSRSTLTSDLPHRQTNGWNPNDASEYRPRPVTGPPSRDELPLVQPRPWTAGESAGEATTRLPSFATLLSSTGVEDIKPSGGHHF